MVSPFKTISRCTPIALLVVSLSSAVAQVESRGDKNQVIGTLNGKAVQNNITVSSLKDLLIERDVALDQQEAFLQEFKVTNYRNASIINLHYACTILSYKGKTSSLQSKGPKGEDIFRVLVPLMGNISELASNDVTTIDCDYLMRPGLDLEKAEIEFEAVFQDKKSKAVLYRRFRFSGRRNSAGNFYWLNGAFTDGPFVYRPKLGKLAPIALVVPFGGDNRSLSPCPTAEEYFSLVLDWVKRLKAQGSRVMVSTIIAGKYESCNQGELSDLPQNVNSLIRANTAKFGYYIVDVAAVPYLAPPMRNATPEKR